MDMELPRLRTAFGRILSQTLPSEGIHSFIVMFGQVNSEAAAAMYMAFGDWQKGVEESGGCF